MGTDGTAYYLVPQGQGHRWACHDDGVKFRIVKSGGKHAYIGNNRYFPGLERFKDALTLFLWRFTRNNGRPRNAPRESFGFFQEAGKDQNAFPFYTAFRIHKPLDYAYQEPIEVYTLVFLDH